MKSKLAYLYICLFLLALILLVNILSQKKLKAPATAWPAATSSSGLIIASTSPVLRATSSPIKQPGVGLQLIDALTRVTKKPFGLKISPQNSPVTPERFSGYHTGVDFEILPGEENTEVAVSAICQGKLSVIRRVKGYGGVVVQTCRLNNQAVTVLYGHLALSTIKQKAGDALTPGDLIGYLGQGYSYDTDGERKHLHLAIHRGADIVYLGYVQKQSELSQWIDYMTLLK